MRKRQREIAMYNELVLKRKRKLNMYNELMFCYALNENKAEGERMQGLIEKRMANDGIDPLEGTTLDVLSMS